VALSLLQSVSSLPEFTNVAIPKNTKAMDSICALLKSSSKKIYDVSIPDTGTISDKGATVDAGYFLIRLFHTMYPNIVVV
jgi:hypothetical protein